MPGKIHIRVPGAGEDLQRYFAALAQRDDEFRRALDLSVAEFDALAQLTEVTVTGVETGGAGVVVSYSVAWEAFHACADQNISGRHARIARGRVERGDWVFEVAASLPERHAADEF
ncbi:hypothetical protein [Roseateles asaccharophilus]|uniref:SnoaL-like domain-containing protein n=1 Tax=Roseateles asaccharophilus TaxID=582607 RepID=A0ABU2AFX8_9BURK|nr:hypothetical protein [Roseateles asaccharophilus]MDR7335980.1 hypothetical protein [Roseateles asaccharophilus]